MVGNTPSQPSIDVQLPVGSRVQLLEDVEVETVDGEVDGGSSTIVFEDYVERHSADTALLAFEDSDIGLAEFTSKLEEADGLAIYREEDVKNV